MKVIFVNPPIDISKILGAGSIFSPPVDPMGIMYIASYVRKHSPHIEVEIIDAFLEKYTLDETLGEILQKRPGIVGISTVTANGHETFELGKKIKELLPETCVVLGNLHASIFKDFYLTNNTCDVVVHGEGERPMQQVAEAVFSGNGDFSQIQGISFKSDNGIIDNPEADHLDLADIPFPAWDLIDYYRYGVSPRGYNIVFFSRGCVFRCHFCVVHQNKYRCRPVDHVIAEIKYLLHKFGITYFAFGDPLFLGKPRVAAELCESIIKEGLHRKIKWWCEAHVNVIDEGILRLMKDAGCSHLSFGIESGNDDILKTCNKKSNTSSISKAVELADKIGFITSGCFIIGLPGDTEETINQTIKFSNQLPLDSAQFSTFCPYPGSHFYHRLMQEGYFKVDFDNVDKVLNFWDNFSAYTAFTKNLEPIYSPDGISPKRLKKLQKKAFIRFYCRPRHFKSQIPRINKATVVGITKSIFRLFGK